MTTLGGTLIVPTASAGLAVNRSIMDPAGLQAFAAEARRRAVQSTNRDTSVAGATVDFCRDRKDIADPIHFVDTTGNIAQQKEASVESSACKVVQRPRCKMGVKAGPLGCVANPADLSTALNRAGPQDLIVPEGKFVSTGAVAVSDDTVFHDVNLDHGLFGAFEDVVHNVGLGVSDIISVIGTGKTAHEKQEEKIPTVSIGVDGTISRDFPGTTGQFVPPPTTTTTNDPPKAEPKTEQAPSHLMLFAVLGLAGVYAYKHFFKGA